MLATSTKRAVNLSVNRSLLDEARELEINLSREFEQFLAQTIQARRQEIWLAENHAALQAYNEHVERDGIFSDGLRSF